MEILANEANGRVNICFKGEEDHLWKKGDILWGHVMKVSYTAVFNNWAEYETHEFTEYDTVFYFTEKANESYSKWLNNMYESGL